MLFNQQHRIISWDHLWVFLMVHVEEIPHIVNIQHLHINKQRSDEKKNGANPLPSKWHDTSRKTDSWHFTPQPTIKSVFISSRGKGWGKTVCIMETASAHTNLHTPFGHIHTHPQKAAVSEDSPRTGIPISHSCPQASRQYRVQSSACTAATEWWAVPHADSPTPINECDI